MKSNRALVTKEHVAEIYKSGSPNDIHALNKLLEIEQSREQIDKKEFQRLIKQIDFLDKVILEANLIKRPQVLVGLRYPKPKDEMEILENLSHNGLFTLFRDSHPYFKETLKLIYEHHIEE